jgi:hypothetical protein
VGGNTMKNNRKNRRLRYIREKNHLRLGGELIQFFKISNELLMSEFGETHIKSEVNHLMKKTDKYKLNLKHEIQIGQGSDDFLSNTKTVRLKTCKK